VKFKNLKRTVIAAAVGAATVLSAGAAVAADQFVGSLVYRTGPYAPGGIPWADGFSDYFSLLNERDGGINGVAINLEECDTAYNTDKGVECYERLKGNGLPAVLPLSTGITYALLDRVVQDKIPLISSGYGRADAADGRIFPYVFVPPATYWSGADVAIQYISAQEGGDLSGKKIALVYHDSAYGKEPIKTLEALADIHGFKLHLFPVAHPGLEQKATWLKIGRQVRPDYTLMWGWGVMNSTAIKEAAAVGFPRDKFIGVWWSGNEPDVIPAGDAAVGYKALQFNSVGSGFPVHTAIKKALYGSDKKGSAESADKVGEVAYNRGMQSAIILSEAIRGAMAAAGKNEPVTGEQVRDAMEKLDITAARIEEIGAKGLMDPIKLTCEDHLGQGRAQVTQWDGKSWKVISDWITPNQDMLRAMYEESAAAYAKEKGITPRSCN
jgi:branched-chain amino acid transport system substrate-binding protein